MSTTLNERRYRELLDVTLPVAIRTEEDYHRLLSAAATIVEKPEDEISESVTLLPPSAKVEGEWRRCDGYHD